MILTVDLGTTATKAALWDGGGMVAIARSRLSTEHPAPGWAEQDATAWWRSVVAAVAGLPSRDGVAAVGFTGARQTFVPVSDGGDPIGPGILWSDARGDGSVLGKLQWLQAHQPERVATATWVLCPRDLVVWKATGVVCTDWTMASASGLYATDGSLCGAAAPFASLLPDPVASTSVVGGLGRAAARELGLAAGTPVVIGAGDRQCEVLGAGATPAQPMVSWGTTANVSAPLVGEPAGEPAQVAAGLRARRGALGGWIVEGGVSAAGSLLEWIGRLTGAPVETLVAEAGLSPVGARGLVVLPWLGGARAPWWRADVGAGFVSLAPLHARGDLARAAIEAVALEIGRCVRLFRPDPSALVLAGGGAGSELWVDALAGVTGMPVLRRRWGEAASAGAALLAASAVGAGLELDRINPVVAEQRPDAGAVAAYAGLRERSDRMAEQIMGDGS